MKYSIYTINKGINKSIEFRGLKAQYIWYFGGMVILLMIIFAALYIIGVGAVIGMTIIGPGGVLISIKIFAMSRRFGEHGLMKAIARRQIPLVLKSFSRKIFQHIG